MATSHNTELNKLENTQKQLERYQHNLLGQLKKIENDGFEDLMQLFEGSRVANDEAASKLQLQEILDKLKYVKKAVVLECGSNIPDLKLFEEDLMHIISTVQDLKVKSNLKVQELTSEENNLMEDIKLYEERLSYWSEPVKLDSIKNAVHAKIDSSNTVPEDVKKFMDYVKCSNGHENGWSVNDNQLFLKLRKKCKNVDEVAVNLNKILPDITIKDVKMHEEWYLKYLELKEKHNIAIENWKKSKQEIKNTDSKRVNECVKSEGLKKNVANTKMLEKKAIEKKKAKEEIEKWKKEREIAKIVEKTLLIEESKQNKKKESQQEKINRIKSEMVIQWKAEKNCLEKDRQCDEQTRYNMEHNVRVSVANKMIKFYQIQDKLLMQKKMQKSLDKRKNFVHKPKSKYEGNRDPMRLFKPTQQWINRFLANDENIPIKPVTFINKVPKLRIPAWRKNVNESSP